MVRTGAPVALVVAVVLAAQALACGGNSLQTVQSNIAGDYSVTLTNGSNACQFVNWTAGSSARDVRVTLQQQGSNATATVNGLAGLLFYATLGTPVFQGTVAGDSFTLTAFGSNAVRDGQCSFTIKATLTGTITGDAIQGQLAYTETTNDSPACAYHATCSSVQSFAGVRAPAGDGG